MADTFSKVSEPKNPSNERSPRVVIGRRMQIEGELHGEENVLIEGRAEGTIEVKNSSLTSRPKGSVRSGLGW